MRSVLEKEFTQNRKEQDRQLYPVLAASQRVYTMYESFGYEWSESDMTAGEYVPSNVASRTRNSPAKDKDNNVESPVAHRGGNQSPRVLRSSPAPDKTGFAFDDTGPPRPHLVPPRKKSAASAASFGLEELQQKDQALKAAAAAAKKKKAQEEAQTAKVPDSVNLAPEQPPSKAAPAQTRTSPRKQSVPQRLCQAAPDTTEAPKAANIWMPPVEVAAEEVYELDAPWWMRTGVESKVKKGEKTGPYKAQELLELIHSARPSFKQATTYIIHNCKKKKHEHHPQRVHGAEVGHQPPQQDLHAAQDQSGRQLQGSTARDRGKGRG